MWVSYLQVMALFFELHEDASGYAGVWRWSAMEGKRALSMISRICTLGSATRKSLETSNAMMNFFGLQVDTMVLRALEVCKS